MVYREDYGGEIGSKRWLSQFISKNRDSILGYEEEITKISGATISVKSMTASINHFFYFFLVRDFCWGTNQSIKLKTFLTVEPFVSQLITIDEIYMLWLGYSLFSYVVVFSGILMTLSYTLGVLVVFKDVF